jgi:peptidoglycan/LPS O-acetylase OafA/YrhL
MDLLIYSVCLGLGIFFLLIAVVVEHLFPDPGTDPMTDETLAGQALDNSASARSRLWSPTRVAAFVLGFGAVGVGLNQFEATAHPALTFALSLLGGAGLALIVQALCRRWFPPEKAELMRHPDQEEE